MPQVDYDMSELIILSGKYSRVYPPVSIDRHYFKSFPRHVVENDLDAKIVDSVPLVINSCAGFLPIAHISYMIRGDENRIWGKLEYSPFPQQRRSRQSPPCGIVMLTLDKVH